MREKWTIHNKKADFNAISAKYGIDKVIARIVTNRGITSPEELEDYFALPEEFPSASGQMKDIEKAVDLIAAEIKSRHNILIIGDYDADGVCSSVILFRTLSFLGAKVSYRIPHRIYDGYGMNEAMVREALSDGVDCIITCDNGISAADAVALAVSSGITVIITDHHTIPFEETDGKKTEKIPMAHAIVNPHQSDCPYPFKEICGAVVALRLCEELLTSSEADRTACAGGDDDKLKLLLTELYDLAAVATMTDVMPLLGENRRIVKRGLNRIPQSPNLGLRTLCELTLPDRDKLSGYHIGFIIGPCINAAGRMDTADKAVRLLLSEDKDEAVLVANELIELNNLRKTMTKEGATEGLAAANAMLEQKVLVIYQPTLHESLAGLVAGRVREATGKPTIVITDAQESSKGSCRSIEGYNIIEEITKNADLLTHYGGHPMAAGFSIPTQNIQEFSRRMNDGCIIPLDELVPKIKIDIAMPLSYVAANPQLVDELDILEPLGKGNESPVFAIKDVPVQNATRIGKERDSLRLTIIEGQRKYAILLFKRADEFLEYCCEKFSEADKDAMLNGRDNAIRLNIVYTPSFNDYNGNRSVQFVMDRFQ